MATRHRKDITYLDLYFLARFVHALNVVVIRMYSPTYELGNCTLRLPTWHLSGGIWLLSAYREYEESAIGISRNDMQTVCDYLGLPMREMLEVLYRLSMLSVTPDCQITDDKPHFRQAFSGIPIECAEFDYGESMRRYIKKGFILEKRRSMGLFKGGDGDEKSR